MATDTTSITTESSNSGNIVHESDVEQVHLTQANAAPVVVQVPQGADVVRVQVTPGETIQLPFPSNGLIARLGENGNLAVKVGDVTVILLGYAEATGQSDVTIIGSDGAAVDVAAVLASTDPNLDIQTAAGPGAGDQGAGVDNNGGLFTPFDPAAGIGGLNAVGGLDPTALDYNLIENQNILYDPQDDVLVDQTPTILSIGTVLINEDDFLGGEYNDYYREQSFGFGSGGYNGNDQYDSNDNDADGASGPTDGTGNNDDYDKEPMFKIIGVDVDFHGEVPGDLRLLDTNLPTDWKSNGNPIIWQLVNDHELVGLADGMPVIHVVVLNAPSMDGHFELLVELLAPLDHPSDGESPDVQDLLTANIEFQVIDSTGTAVQASFPATFEDDVPFDAQVHYFQESEATQGQIDEDALKGGVPGDSVNGDDDGTNYVDGYISVAFGGDGPANVEPFKFSVTAGTETGLFTATGDIVLWGVDGNQHVFGYIAGNENDHVFDARVYDSGYFEFYLNQPLQHDGHDNPDTDGVTETAFEDNLVISIPVIATDNDGDTISTGIAINVDDDMPRIDFYDTEEGSGLTLTSDETVGGANNFDVGAINPPTDGGTVENDETFVTEPASLQGKGYGSVIGGSAGSFVDVFTFIAGADGEKSHEYGLSILDETTNIKDTQTGLLVTLVQDADGTVRGVVDDNGTELTVFALVLDDQSGDITFVQYRAVDHGADQNSLPDEILALGEGHLAATLSVTDNDGDTATASSDLGNQILFEDDGPVVGNLETLYFDDDILPNGNPGGAGDNAPDADNLGNIQFDNDGHPYIEGTFPVEFGSDGPGSIQLSFAIYGPYSFELGVPQLGGGSTSLIVSYQGVEYIRFEILDQTTGAYRITQLAPLPHQLGGDENDLSLSLGLRFTDGDGDFVDKTLNVNFDDDTPIAFNDYDGVANLQSTDGNVITGVGTNDPANGKDAGGADGAAVSAISSVEEPANQPVATNDVVHGDGFIIQGEHGSLTIYADGYYVYTRSDSDPLIGDDKFTYTLTDGDQDSVQATIDDQYLRRGDRARPRPGWRERQHGGREGPAGSDDQQCHRAGWYRRRC
jgi:hypothetical protein